MDRAKLRLLYDARCAQFERLREEAVFCVQNSLGTLGVKLHSITSRVKEFESVASKAERKAVEDPLNTFHDLVGLRIVCLFLSDLPRIASCIRATFDVLAEDDRIQSGDLTSFGYMSWHLDAALKHSYSGPRYDGLAKVPFEIQLRTIAMDAWANVAHHLSYKTDIDIPDELKKDFNALSGLFYVADKHFELFYSASIKSRREALQTAERGGVAAILPQPLNVDTLAAYLASKMADRQHANAAALSELISEVSAVGLCDLPEIDRLVDTMRSAVDRYEVHNGRLQDVGVVRVSLYLADIKYFQASFGALSRKLPEQYIRAAYVTQYAPYRAG